MTDERRVPPWSPSPPARPSWPGSTLAWLLGIAAVLALVYLFRGLALPLFLAAVVAYLLNPLVARAEALAIRRSVAVTGLCLGIALIVSGVGIGVVPRFRAEGIALAVNLPALTATVETAIDRAALEVGEAYPGVRRFLPAGKGREGWLQEAVEGRMAEALAHAGDLVLVLILIPVFAFFLLRDGRRMAAYLLDRLHPVHIETSVAVWYELDGMIGRYLRGLALEAIAVGILAALGLWVIGVPYPLLLGALTAFVNPVPLLGPVFSASVAGVVSLAQGQGLQTVGWIIALYLLIRLLDDLVIAPLTVGRSGHLHPALVVASIIAGEQTLGLLGMVIAVPTVTVVKEIARLLLEHRRTLTRADLPGTVRPPVVPHYVC